MSEKKSCSIKWSLGITYQSGPDQQRESPCDDNSAQESADVTVFRQREMRGREGGRRESYENKKQACSNTGPD